MGMALPKLVQFAQPLNLGRPNFSVVATVHEDQEGQLRKLWGVNWRKTAYRFINHNGAKAGFKIDLKYRFKHIIGVGAENIMTAQSLAWLLKQKDKEAEAIRGQPDFLVAPEYFEFFVEVKWPEKSNSSDTRQSIEAIQFYHNIRREHPILYILPRQLEPVKCVWGHQLTQHPDWVGSVAYWKGRAPDASVLEFLLKMFGTEKLKVWDNPPPAPATGELHLKLEEEARDRANDYITEVESIPSRFQKIQREFENCKRDISLLESSSDQQPS